MDQNQELPSAEMALAAYSATAATLAISRLRLAGLLQAHEVTALAETLSAVRIASGMNPILEEHLEKLLDMLIGSELPE
jgi:hypothetical protein